ncbi:MAG: YIP1 family protein [Candidatus Micrarchaeota archaeon]
MANNTKGKKAEAGKRVEDQLEDYADGLVNSIKYDRLFIWKELFFHPTATIEKQMDEPHSLKRAAKDVFVASLPMLLLGSVGLIIVFAYFGFLGGIFSLALFQQNAIFVIAGGVVLALIVFCLYLLGPVIGWYIYSWLQCTIAKMLGGKGDFRTHAYLNALAIAATQAAEVPFLLLTLLICLNSFVTPIRMLIGYYGLYLQYKVVKNVHGVTDVNAAIAVLVPIFLITGLAFVSVFVAYFGFWALIMGSFMAAKTATG